MTLFRVVRQPVIFHSSVARPALTGGLEHRPIGRSRAGMQGPQRFLDRDAEDVQVTATDFVNAGIP